MVFIQQCRFRMTIIAIVIWLHVLFDFRILVEGSNGAALLERTNHHHQDDAPKIGHHLRRKSNPRISPTKNFSELSRCSKYQDNIGSWVNKTSLTIPSDIYRYFHKGNIGQVDSFDMIWIPEGCSYHRFSNFTMLQAVDKLLSNLSDRSNATILHTVFFGDSALRGIFCAIYRILMGSETTGPCMNEICGFDEKRREISIPRIHRPRSVMLGERWRVTFYYAKSFHVKQLPQLIAQVIQQDRPYAVIVNTGAWDFYEYTKRHREEIALIPTPPNCHNNDTTAISNYRSNAVISDAVKTLAEIASNTRPMFLSQNSSAPIVEAAAGHVRLIYRNNHYNRRYGALCADTAFEALLTTSNTIWEIWDNRGLSESVWLQQCYDGFHFDWPILTYTVEDHMRANSQLRQILNQQPGMLAMQLAQSFLNNLFYDVISAIQHQFEDYL